MEGSWELQMAADGPLVERFPSLPVQQVHGLTTNHGDINIAGRDIHIHKHYHSYCDRVDIGAVLGAIRNMRTIHLAILSKATPGTGIWFLKTDKFVIWLDPNGNLKILWGSGIPNGCWEDGSGISLSFSRPMIAQPTGFFRSIVVRELEALAAAETMRICVCYVYIRYSDRAHLSVRSVLEILVKQTVERHPECAVLAEQAYARHVREKTQPTEAELLQLLHQFTETTEVTFYILDALDEAPDRLQVDLVLKLASLNVRLFITSRPLKTVEARAPNAHCFPIIAQEGDLDLHIAQEISCSRDLQVVLDKTGPSLREEIVSLVKSKCGGMFLHASLQLEALCQCVSTFEVRQTLDMFPSRIEDVYLQTWDRVLGQKPYHVILAKAVLVWLLNASRSMTIEELERALATSPDTYKFDSDRVVPGKTLLVLCRGLVMFEEESRVVRLVHYTAKDTLQELLRDSSPLPHTMLTAVCLTHLTDCGFQDASLRSAEEFIAARQADPLLAYASDAWAFHVRQSPNVEGTRQRAANFVSGTIAFPTFTSLDLSEHFDILSPLHILAIHDLPTSLIPYDNIGNPNVTTQIDRESPLMLASWRGHDAIFELLISHSEIKVNLVTREGWSALMLAARHGHKSAVNLFLARPEIEVNLVDNYGWSALMLAASNGHENIVEPLLARPETKVNLATNKGWSALMLAARHGHKSAVNLILARPEIEVNLVNAYGWSALMLAASNGHENIIESLLARPETKVNLATNKGWSALMLATRYCHEGIANLLLARPEIEIHLADNEGWTALMLSAHHGCRSIGERLIAHPNYLARINLLYGLRLQRFTIHDPICRVYGSPFRYRETGML